MARATPDPMLPKSLALVDFQRASERRGKARVFGLSCKIIAPSVVPEDVVFSRSHLVKTRR